MKPAQSRDRVLTNAEIVAIRKAIVPWARDVFEFALLTGLRWGDLSNLTRDKIDLDGGFIKLIQGKNRREVTIPLTTEARAIVDRHYHNIARCGYLFANTTGGRLRKVRQQWIDAKAKAGVKGVTWHDIRHTFASRLAEKGASRDEVASYIGDSRSSQSCTCIFRSNTGGACLNHVLKSQSRAWASA